jgi:hypothetical protein
MYETNAVIRELNYISVLGFKFTLPGFLELKVFSREVGYMVGLTFLRRGFEDYSLLGHEAI